MFDPTSRYYNIKNATYTAADGRQVIYKRRRLLPEGDSMPVMAQVSSTQSEDRLDLITARSLGNPEQFWRICDANNAMNPFDLIDESGGVLRVPKPQA